MTLQIRLVTIQPLAYGDCPDCAGSLRAFTPAATDRLMTEPLPPRWFLSTAPATLVERTAAIVVIAVSFLAFLVTVPFVRVPLARIPAFIPAYQSALLIIDLKTAVLLFGQFIRLRSRAILALAAGYLFDAAMIIPHTLSFPGVFAPTGLIAAGEQTTAWLYVFWHGGFPLFVLTYVYFRSRPSDLLSGDPRPALFAAVAGSVALAVIDRSSSSMMICPEPRLPI